MTQDVHATRAAVWRLRMISGAEKGMAWPLSETPLLIGRSLGCHICINDKHISRVQCEGLLVDGAPHLRHRSRTVPTLVNGAVCIESPLKLGDVIEFSRYRLIVELVQRDTATRSPDSDTGATTQGFDDSVFLREDANSPVREDTPAFADNLLALFTLQRSLARAGSVDKLVEQLKAHLAKRFGPCGCWVALRAGSNDQLVFVPPASTADRADAPVPALEKALQLREGVLASSTLSAPLMHSDEAFGAIAVRRESNEVPYAPADLHYLLAVAECASPLILAAERSEQLRRDKQTLHTVASDPNHLRGASPAMVDVRKDIERAAKSRGNVLLLGETGVGKELAARIIHDSGPRASGPYVVVNCAAIPENLFESEFFGFERGAFTGASESKKGLMEQAHGGTLFLDEVGELSPTNQARLLRAAETKAIRRLGGARELCIDVRILSATNRSLLGNDRHQFRQDLFYRLAGAILWIPPLRDRPEDLPDLARHFLLESAPHSTARPVDFSDEAFALLQSYRWPGNVRELRNVVENAAYAATGRLITPRNLSLTLAESPAPGVGSGKQLEELERNHLIDVLRANDGNVAQTAEALGIAASTLYYKLRRHKISLKKRGIHDDRA